MWRGRGRLHHRDAVRASASCVQFLIGGLSGIWVASPALDCTANDSYVVVAHFHYTLFGGSVFGLFAAIYLLVAEVDGRAAARAASGKVHFWPDVRRDEPDVRRRSSSLGEDGMTRRIADYPALDGLGDAERPLDRSARS